MIEKRRNDAEFRNTFRTMIKYHKSRGGIAVIANGGSDQTEFWNNFFYLCYGSLPSSNNDPRWEDLLYKKGSLHAQCRINKIAKRNKLRQHNHI